MRKKLIGGVLLALTIVSVMFWLNREAWLENFNNERSEEKARFTQAGLNFATENNQQECLNKALQEFDGCLGYSCTVNNAIFLKACLSKAAISPNFCDGVPAFEEKPSEDAKSWAKYYCWDNNIRGEGCRLLMKQQSFFCSQ